VKKILLALLGSLILVGSLAVPPVLHADGVPTSPNCPPGKMCRP